MLFKTLLIPLVLGLGLVEAAEIHPHHQERRKVLVGPGKYVEKMEGLKPTEMGKNYAQLCHPGKYHVTVTDKKEMFLKVADKKLMSNVEWYDCLYIASTDDQEQVFQADSYEGYLRASKGKESKCTIDTKKATVTCPPLNAKKD